MKLFNQFRRAQSLALRLSLAVVFLAPLGVKTFAQSQSTQPEASGALEEIVVTSQQRTQSLQDVPVSVNVVSGDKITEGGISKIEDLQGLVPNLSQSETGIGTNIFIRGIGSGINQGFEQSVGLYTDGVYYGRAQQSRAPFLDVERIEVLRGPQNILYGKDSIAGALSIFSAQPTDEFEGSVGVTVEPEFGEAILDVTLSGPLAGGFSWRVAHRTRQLDGYIDNVDLADEPERDESTTRVILDWDISDTFNANFKTEIGTYDVVGRQIELLEFQASPILPGNPTWSEFLLGINPLNAATGADITPTSILDTEIDFDRAANGDFSDNDTENFTLSLNYDLNGYNFTSITSQSGYEYDELCDCDFTSANIFFVQSQEEFDQFSQEIRVTSPGGQTIDWIAGLYYQTSDLDFNDEFFTTETSVIGNILDTVLPLAFVTPDGDSIFPAGGAQQLNNLIVPREFVQDSELFAGFVQATLSLSDSWRITAGGRLSEEDKDASRVLDFTDADGNVIPFDDSFIPGSEIGLDYILGAVLQVARHDLEGSRTESNFAPLLNVEYDFGVDSLAYATWARGFKSGGFDVRSNTAPFASDAAGNLIPTTIESPISDALDVSIPAGTFDFEEEQATNFELGIKSRFWGGRAEINAAAFLTDYEELQVSQFDGVLSFNVGNAAEAQTAGLEVDGRVAISDYVTLSGALALLDFEFQDFDTGQCTQAQRLVDPTITDCDFDGFSNQFVADFSGALAVDYTNDFGSNLLFSGTFDTTFTSDYNPAANVDPAIEQNGFAKFNLRLGLSDIDRVWEVAILAKNLTNEEVVTFANDIPLATNLGFSQGFYGFVESPRTVAVQGTYRF